MQMGVGSTGNAGAVIKNSYCLLSTDSMPGGFTCIISLGLHGNSEARVISISILQTGKLRRRKVKSTCLRLQSWSMTEPVCSRICLALRLTQHNYLFSLMKRSDK